MDRHRTGAAEARRHSRRHALALAAGAALLAACGSNAPSAPATSVPPTPIAPTPAATGAGTSATMAAPLMGTTAIRVPNNGAMLPTDKVMVHWIDSGGVKAVFERAYYAAYSQAHPNITVQYDELPWEEINKVVPLGVQNGNAPDVFQIPTGLTGAQVVQQGWVHPLDDIVPNFAQWKAAFPPGIFYEGINVFNGKTYTFPFWSNKNTNLLLYNTAYLQQAGIDPQAKPLTWDEFRAAAKKLTQQGAGKYYGVIFAGNQQDRWATIVRDLGRFAGAGSSSGGGFDDLDFKTGDYTYTSDPYRAAIDLLLALKADGSVFPGSLTLNDAMARAQFPNGVAALIIEGVYNIGIWKQMNPTFAFDIASQPMPNGGAFTPIAYQPGGTENFWVFSKSKYPAVAGDLMRYMGSEEGQTAVLSLTGGSRQSVFPKANTAAELEPRVKRAIALFDQQLRLGPNAAVRNPDFAQVLLEQRPLTPNFGTVIQGIYTGQLADAKKALQDLQDRSNAELDRAIKAAQMKGAKVSRDDLKFPNWDPTKDYTDADYATLRKQ